MTYTHLAVESFVCMCMHACMYVCMTYAHLAVESFVCTCMCVCMHVCMYVYMYTCMTYAHLAVKSDAVVPYQCHVHANFAGVPIFHLFKLVPDRANVHRVRNGLDVCVCSCMCIYVRKHVCMYASMQVCIYLLADFQPWAEKKISLGLKKYVCISVCTHTRCPSVYTQKHRAVSMQTDSRI
jgi:hypothetical protein